MPLKRNPPGKLLESAGKNTHKNSSWCDAESCIVIEFEFRKLTEFSFFGEDFLYSEKTGEFFCCNVNTCGIRVVPTAVMVNNREFSVALLTANSGFK